MENTQQAISALQAYINTQQPLLDIIKQTIAVLDSNYQAALLAGDLKTATDNVAQLESALEAKTTEVQVKEATINELTSQVSAKEATIGELTSQIVTLENTTSTISKDTNPIEGEGIVA